MPYKNILLLGIFVLFVWSCSSDDDAQLFLEKYDMTLWINRDNGCDSGFPANGAPYYDEPTYFLRFEKNLPGYIKFFEPSYSDNFCEQANWECWVYTSRYWFSQGLESNYIEIVSHSYGGIIFNVFRSDERNELFYNVQLAYKNDVLNMRIEDYLGRVDIKSYVKSDIDFNSLDFCD